MAHIFEDRVLETTTTTGTGDLTLAGALAGFRSFGSVMAVSDQCWYAVWAVDGSGNPTGAYEAGLGTYSGTNTLTRTTVQKSSNAGAAVSFAAGTKLVSITAIAAKTVQQDPENAFVLPVLTVASGTPSVIPATDTLKVFARSRASRMFLGAMGPDGWDYSLQPNLFSNKLAWAVAAGNSTTLTTMGVAITATGTATAANVATTNVYTKMRLIEYLVTAAATTAVAGWRSAAAQFYRDMGFFMVQRFGPSTGVATTTNRCFVGMAAATAAPTDVEPSSQVNILGFGWDAADTNIQFMRNDASGTATKVDLGASFPVPTADRTKAYEVSINCPPGGSTVYYEIRDLGTGARAAGSVTTDLPTGTTLLAPRGYMSVGGTSSVIGIALGTLYIETDD